MLTSAVALELVASAGVVVALFSTSEVLTSAVVLELVASAGVVVAGVVVALVS